MTNKKDMEVKTTDREDINERITEKPTNQETTVSKNDKIEYTTQEIETKEPTTTQIEIKETINSTIQSNISETNPIIIISTNEKTEHLTSVLTTSKIIKTTNQIVTPNSTIIYNEDNIIPTTEMINNFQDYFAVIIGFTEFVNHLTKITFNIYLASLNGLFYSKRLRFSVEITSYRILRMLDIYYAECESTDKEKKAKLSYSCVIDTQIEKIKNARIIGDFIFSDINCTVSYNPLAEYYKDRLNEIGNYFNFLKYSSVYILNHSTIGEVEKKYFNLSGIINNQKPKFKKTNISLIALTNINNESKSLELECNITDIIYNNYTINCKRTTVNNNYNLQNSISIIEDEILIVHFDNGVNSNITYEVGHLYRRFVVSKDGKNLSTGAILAIILVIIAVIAALIATFIFLRRKDINQKIISESAIMNLKK